MLRQLSLHRWDGEKGTAQFSFMYMPLFINPKMVQS